MNNLLTLYKYNILSFLNRINKSLFKKSKNKGKLSMLIGGALFLGIVIYAVIIFYLLVFEMMFSAGGKPEGIFYIVIIAITMLTFMGGVTKSNSYLFRMKDYNFLVAMPIKNSTIIISKLTTLIFEAVALSLLIGMPTMVVYYIYAPSVSSLYWLYGIIIFICLPLIPLVVSSFLSFLFGFIPINSRVKNVISSVIYVIFIVAFMSLYTMTDTTDENISNQVQEMISSLEKVYILGPTLILGILGNTKWFIIYASATLILMAIFIIIVSLGFNKMTNSIDKTSSKKVKSKTKSEDYKHSSPLKTLIKKELIMYLNIPAYILNTIVGPVMSVVITVVFSTKLSSFSEGTIEGIEFTKNMFVLFVTLMMIFFFTMTSTSASGISVEGKNYWIMKSSPISYKDVFLSKMFLNLLITVPFLIVDVIIAIVLLKADFYLYIGMILIPLLFVIGTTAMGLLFNIYFPKFKYDNVQKVIKNGLPVLLTMLFSFVMLVILFVSLVLSIVFINDVVAMIVLIALGLIYCSVFLLILYTKGVKRFNKIEV